MLAKVLPWVATIGLNIVAPIVVYGVLTSQGFGEVPALILSGIPPAVEMVATIAIARRIDEFSLFVLIILAVSVVATVISGSARVLLLREAAVTGTFGVILLLSLLTRRPLMFYFGRRFATDGSRAQVAWWNGLWRYPGFRRSQRVITSMWGITFVVEAAVRTVLTFSLSVETMVAVNSIVPNVIVALLVLATLVLAQRARAAGNAANPGSADAPPSDTPEPQPA